MVFKNWHGVRLWPQKHVCLIDIRCCASSESRVRDLRHWLLKGLDPCRYRPVVCVGVSDPGTSRTGFWCPKHSATRLALEFFRIVLYVRQPAQWKRNEVGDATNGAVLTWPRLVIHSCRCVLKKRGHDQFYLQGGGDAVCSIWCKCT